MASNIKSEELLARDDIEEILAFIVIYLTLQLQFPKYRILIQRAAFYDKAVFYAALYAI